MLRRISSEEALIMYAIFVPVHMILFLTLKTILKMGVILGFTGPQELVKWERFAKITTPAGGPVRGLMGGGRGAIHGKTQTGHLLLISHAGAGKRLNAAPPCGQFVMPDVM